MVTKRQKQAVGFAATAVLLLGSAYAWQTTNQHKTNESLGDGSFANDVTLVEDYEPIEKWSVGQTKNKDIAVKNNATLAEGGSAAYVRINIREFLEVTPKKETFSDVRYAVKIDGEFAKFPNTAQGLQDAQTYAAANGLDAADIVLIPKTSHEGDGADDDGDGTPDGQYFIKTKAGAYHGQYGKFLSLSIEKQGDAIPVYGSTRASEDAQRDPNGDGDESDGKHQAVTHGEDAYPIQTFGNSTGNGVNGKRLYPGLLTDTPTNYGIEVGKDLKNYITWLFGPDVIMLADYDPATETTAKWVINPDDGWIYWSKGLKPEETTSQFLDAMRLIASPNNVAFYYAIHTHLEAYDYMEMEKLTDLPADIETSWKSLFSVTFDTKGGSVIQDMNVKAGGLITEPPVPTKADYEFMGWYQDSSYKTAWDFGTDTMPEGNLTLYAKWLFIPHVSFKDLTGTTTILPDQAITNKERTLNIPDAPAKADHYFLGWAESANAAKTATLYVPSTYTDVRLTLNAPDKTYLGYTVKSAHAIENMTADKTLYAVYYKAKEAVTTAGDEFIWADAIWRNLKTDMDTSIPDDQALVIKVNALTQKEATGSGATTGAYGMKFLQTQTTYFSSTGANGYLASDNNVRKANEYYYTNSLSTTDKASVNAVDLQNPNFNTFKSGITLSSGSAYNNWYWDNGYKDTRFETKVDRISGTKQAFALSYGDINTTMGLLGSTSSALLNFLDSNDNVFWLRLTTAFAGAGRVNQAAFDLSTPFDYTRTVRPALSLTLQ